MLDKADAIRRKRKEAITLTEELLRSAFLDMFGDPVTNPKGWPVKPLGDIVERIVVGHVGPTSHGYADIGVPFLRTQNVRPMRLSLIDIKYITPQFHEELNKSTIRASDILVSRVGANRGMAAVVPSTLDGANCANILVITPGVKLASTYLAFLINSPLGEQQLVGPSVGSAQGVINASAIKSWELPVPPKSEQERFVRFESLIRQANAKQEAQADESNHLFSSLVDRAFRGELKAPSIPSTPSASKNKQISLFGD